LTLPGLAALDQRRRVPKADRQAVPKSTQGNLIAIG
jgi:hypothetical protein